MNYKSFLTKLKVSLGVEVKFEQMNLADGTAIEAESFEAGEAVFIVNEDGNIPLPVGSYDLEDGRQLLVEEEGLIAAVGAAESEAEEEMEKDASPEYVTKADFDAFVQSVTEMLSKQAKPEAEEMSGEQTEETKVEVEASKQVEAKTEKEASNEVTIEMSADDMPAAAPVKVNPERQAEKQAIQFSTKRPATIKDSVFAKIAAIKH